MRVVSFSLFRGGDPRKRTFSKYFSNSRCTRTTGHRTRCVQVCAGMAPIGNARYSTQKHQKVLPVRPVGAGQRAPRLAYDNHQRAEVVACMLLPRPLTLAQTGDEVVRKGSALHGFYRRPHRRTMQRIRRRFRRTGLSDAKVGHGGPGIRLTGSQIKALKQWLKAPNGQKRGTRLRFARAWFDATYNDYVHVSTVCRWLKVLDQTRKKGSRTAKQQDPNQVAYFWDRLQDLGFDPWKAAWYDECGFDFRDFLMHYGWGPSNERYYTVEKLGRGVRINCLATVSLTGVVDVGFYHDGSITYAVFEERCLVHIASKMRAKGLKWLIMDNASIHHASRNRIVQLMLNEGITVIWLAPYHPQANPIGE